MDKHMDNSCKPRTEYLCSFFMIIYTECGQCLAFFTQENLAYLVKVNVTADFTKISKFTDPSSPTRENLGMKLYTCKPVLQVPSSPHNEVTPVAQFYN